MGMDSQNNNASGETLRAKIQNGSLYEGDGLQAQIRIIDIAVATAKDLQRAHSKGIVHCDVNPDTIYFDDVGNARVSESALSRRFTMIGENAADAAEDKDAESSSKEQEAASQEETPLDEKTPHEERPLAEEPTFDEEPALDKELPLDETPSPVEEPLQEEPPVKPWMDIHAWALTLLEIYLGEKRWTTGDDAKAHLKEYSASCRLAPPPEMWHLIENCLKWKINDFLIVIKDLEKMPAAVMRAAEAAAAQQESEGAADSESGEQSADSDGDPSRPTASDTDPEYSSAEGTDSSQSDGQPSEGDNAREKQGLFSRIKGLFRSGK